MARPRKTVDVSYVKDTVNYYLRESSHECDLEREAQANLLEVILMQANNYKGFNYINGWPCEDETRRQYY